MRGLPGPRRRIRCIDRADDDLDTALRIAGLPSGISFAVVARLSSAAIRVRATPMASVLGEEEISPSLAALEIIPLGQLPHGDLRLCPRQFVQLSPLRWCRCDNSPC